MKTIKTPFKQMLAAVPADIQQEVDLEFAISNRINELMVPWALPMPLLLPHSFFFGKASPSLSTRMASLTVGSLAFWYSMKARSSSMP